MLLRDLPTHVKLHLSNYMNFTDVLNFAKVEKEVTYKFFIEHYPISNISPESIKNEVSQNNLEVTQKNPKDYEKYLFIWIKLMGNRLTTLHLKNIDISEQTLWKIGNLLKEQNITSITSLDLSYENDDFADIVEDSEDTSELEVNLKTELLDQAISNILAQTKNLKYLNLSGRSGISEETIKLIGNNKELESLYLNECENLNDVLMNNIAEQCKKIKTLEISFCTKITQGEFFTNLNHLVHINLDGCAGCIDITLQNLALKTNLKYLYLSAMHEITIDNVQAILSKNLGLESFSIDHCNQIKLEEVKELTKSLPKIKYLNGKALLTV